MDQAVPNGKAVKFRTLAENRVSRVIKTARQIGNLSRRVSYDYTLDQVDRMFQAMRDELDAAEKKFMPRDGKQQGALFHLD